MSARIRTIIVDDEALSRRGVELRLANEPDFEVTAQCGSGREAVAAICAARPDLVFLDIQMPGMSGFDVLAALPQDSLPLVVFVTAYDTHAVRAFEARAVDYVLKPIEEGRFAATLKRLRELWQQRTAIDQRDRLIGVIADLTGSGELALEELLEKGRAGAAPRAPDILPIRQGRDTVRIETGSIDWIDAAGDYMCVHAAGETYILRGTMKELEDALDPRRFQRVHRSTIVNLARVRSLRAHMNGEYFLKLDGGHELKLSRSYRDKVEYFLRGVVS
jgi:two-component system LytT family response regulator